MSNKSHALHTLESKTPNSIPKGDAGILVSKNSIGFSDSKNDLTLKFRYKKELKGVVFSNAMLEVEYMTAADDTYLGVLGVTLIHRKE